MNLDTIAQQIFAAKVDDSSIYGLNKLFKVRNDIDIYSGIPTFTIEYTLTPDVRSWGIDGITVDVQKITASIEWEVGIVAEQLKTVDKAYLINAGGYEFKSHGTISGTFELDTTVPINENYWEIKSDVEFTSSGGFQIQEVEVDFLKMKITIS